jgi:hypothetical protein
MHLAAMAPALATAAPGSSATEAPAAATGGWMPLHACLPTAADCLPTSPPVAASCYSYLPGQGRRCVLHCHPGCTHGPATRLVALPAPRVRMRGAVAASSACSRRKQSGCCGLHRATEAFISACQAVCGYLCDSHCRCLILLLVVLPSGVLSTKQLKHDDY